MDDDYDFCSAIYTNDISKIKKLIHKGYNLNKPLKETQISEHTTPLILATRLNRTDIISELLRAGSDVNLSATDGINPLSIAIKRQNLNLVMLYLRLGAKTDNYYLGISLLTLACQTFNFKIIDEFIKYHHNVNEYDKFDMTTLQHLCLNTLAEDEEIIDVVKKLLPKGLDINKKNQNGFSALYWSAQLNRLKLAKFLLQNGADANDNSETRLSLLALAIISNKVELVKLLLSFGANPNYCYVSNSGIEIPLDVIATHPKIKEMIGSYRALFKCQKRVITQLYRAGRYFHSRTSVRPELETLFERDQWLSICLSMIQSKSRQLAIDLITEYAHQYDLPKYEAEELIGFSYKELRDLVRKILIRMNENDLVSAFLSLSISVSKIISS